MCGFPFSRAQGTCRAVPALLALLLPLLPHAQPAASAGDVAGGGEAPADAFRLLRRFDFDERKNGNFENTPKHWRRLSGPGLPAYSKGVFDEAVGHDAPPSFRLNLELGSIAYEYGYTDLDVLPGAAYRVVGHIRTRGITHARAFLAAYLVDRFGERLDSSLRVTELAADRPGAVDAWERVSLDLTGGFPQAASLRLQLWVMQSSAWRTADAGVADAIPRQDVQAQVWFDDISVYVVPQTQLRFSDPAHLVRPGQSAALIVEVDNATGRELPVDLAILDERGATAFRERLTVPGGARAPVEFPVPALPPGTYVATLRPEVAFDVPLERQLRFAVLPLLPPAGPHGRDLGVDLSAWPAADAAVAAALLGELNVGAAKMRVPLMGVIDDDAKREQLDDLSAMLQALALARIEAVGVLTPPVVEHATASLREYCEAQPEWPATANPILAQLGGRVSTWQLGTERDELGDGGSWPDSLIEALRAHIQRFNSLPELVVPVSVLAPIAPRRDVRSLWVESAIPAEQVPAYLDFLVEKDDAPRWVQIEGCGPIAASWPQEIVDLARRVTLAKALGPDKLWVSAPFVPENADERGGWQPTAAYVPLRTLFHYLSGKRAASVTHLEPDGLLILFRDDSETAAHCAVAWTWQDVPEEAARELYIGPNAASVDLWGRRRPLEQRDGRALLTLSPTPEIIEGIDLSAALIATTFRVEPTHVQLRNPDPRPVLSFRNGAVGRISGEIEVIPPRDWQVQPQRFRFDLAPGEAVEAPLSLTLPRRLLSAGEELDVRVAVESPSKSELHFAVPLTIGLGDVEMDVSSTWVGDRLVVRQTVRNQSSAAVSFDGFCQPPRHSRSQHAFLDILSGDTAEHTYVFERAAALRGTRIHVGIREIRGERVVERLVDLPP